VDAVDVATAAEVLDVRNVVITAAEDAAVAVTATQCRSQSPLVLVSTIHVVSVAKNHQRKATVSGLACGHAAASARFLSSN